MLFQKICTQNPILMVTYLCIIAVMWQKQLLAFYRIHIYQIRKMRTVWILLLSQHLQPLSNTSISLFKQIKTKRSFLQTIPTSVRNRWASYDCMSRCLLSRASAFKFSTEVSSSFICSIILWEAEWPPLTSFCPVLSTALVKASRLLISFSKFWKNDRQKWEPWRFFYQIM